MIYTDVMMSFSITKTLITFTFMLSILHLWKSMCCMWQLTKKMASYRLIESSEHLYVYGLPLLKKLGEIRSWNKQLSLDNDRFWPRCQITIQEYLWVLFHVNVSMVTADRSLWKDRENTGLIFTQNTKSRTTFKEHSTQKCNELVNYSKAAVRSCLGDGLPSS